MRMFPPFDVANIFTRGRGRFDPGPGGIGFVRFPLVAVANDLSSWATVFQPPRRPAYPWNGDQISISPSSLAEAMAYWWSRQTGSRWRAPRISTQSTFRKRTHSPGYFRAACRSPVFSQKRNSAALTRPVTVTRPPDLAADLRAD